MDLKVLIQAFDRPWLIEPSAAQVWAEVLHGLISSSTPHNVAALNPDAPFMVNQLGQRDASGSVMVIPINGPIMKNDYCGSPGTASMAAMINQANNDSSIKGIVLSISSPGGSVDGTEHLAATIAASKKPVVAHGDMMASAAYWIASQASEVILNGKTSMAGAIGTMAIIRDMRAFQQSRGVNEVIMFASRSVDKNRSTIEAMDGKPEAYQREFLDPINNVFEATIKSGRGDKINYAKEDVGTGKVYLGKNAISAGLADKIGSFEMAVKRTIQLAQKTSNNIMAVSQTEPVGAFQNTLKAAGTSEFEVVEGGFLLSEDQLNSIEANLATSASRISELETQVSQFTDNTETASAAAALAADQLAEAQATIATQAARIAELEALPGNTISETTKPGADHIPGSAEKFVSETTKEANRLRAAAGLPPIA